MVQLPLQRMVVTDSMQKKKENLTEFTWTWFVVPHINKLPLGLSVLSFVTIKTGFADMVSRRAEHSNCQSVFWCNCTSSDLYMREHHHSAKVLSFAL